MTDLQPVDQLEPLESKSPRRRRSGPKQRYRLFAEGDGDVRLIEILSPNEMRMLETPGFTDGTKAKAFIRTNVERFQGKQILIARGLDIVNCELETKPQLRMTTKPKKAIVK